MLNISELMIQNIILGKNFHPKMPVLAVIICNQQKNYRSYS